MNPSFAFDPRFAFSPGCRDGGAPRGGIDDRVARRLVLAGFLALAVPTAAWAQSELMAPPSAVPRGPVAAKPVDPAFAAAEKAFLALDIEARKTIQQDLIWVARFVGTATGDFGPLTFAAIRRFETEARMPVRGILSEAARAQLHKLAEDRRRGAGFSVETDPRSRMRIGLPGFLRAKSAPNASGGMRWQDKDERVTLDLTVYKPEDALPALFEKGIDPKVRGRKITYKLLRPEFFVITGETAGGKFYRRVEKNQKGEVHGFSIGYDKGAATFVDPYIVAIAAAFEPFPKAGIRPGGTPATAPPVADLGPKQRRASGLVLAPDVIVTGEAALKGCAGIAFDPGKGAPPVALKLMRVLGGTGLALLAGKAGTPLSRPSAVPADGPATLVQRDTAGELLASAAEIAGAKVSTSLQGGGAGGAVFDRKGALVGVIAASPVEKFRVAGIVPTLSYPLVPAAEVFRLAGVTAAAGGDATPQSAAAIAEAARGSVIALVCTSDK